MLDDLQSKDNCATVWGNTKASEEKPQWMDENKPIFHDLERERGLR